MATVEGKPVKVGDYVSFKEGMEDCGKIWKIEGSTLYICAHEGGGDEYCTVQDTSRCWIEDF